MQGRPTVMVDPDNPKIKAFEPVYRSETFSDIESSKIIIQDLDGEILENIAIVQNLDASGKEYLQDIIGRYPPEQLHFVKFFKV